MSERKKRKTDKAILWTVSVLLLCCALFGGYAYVRTVQAAGRQMQVTANGKQYFITPQGFGVGTNAATFKRVIAFKPLYDPTTLHATVIELASRVNNPAQNNNIAISGTDVSLISDSHDGNLINLTQSYQTIATAYDKGQTSVTLPTMTDKPTVSLSSAQSAQVEVQNILNVGDLQLTYNGNPITIKASMIGGWIYSSPDGQNLDVNFDTDKIDSDLQTLTKPYDNSSTAVTLAVNSNNQVTNFQAPTTGTELDQAAAEKQIITALQNREDASYTPPGAPLALAAQTVQIQASQSAQQMGIVQLIGTATTMLTGSTKDRIHNIQVGADKLNNTLIAPGAVFSTVKTLGDVDAATGYVPELSIVGDQTIPEYGGGLCQIATTLFRSALNTGLPINERQNHSYRVSYYETDGTGKYIGPGLDATIYDPQPDLQFTNDTGHWILLTDQLGKNTLTFNMYGTSDGRKVNIDGPHTLSVIPAPPSIYTNTDKLPVGKTEKTDTAHPGGAAIATYTVTYADGTVKKQVFNSYYKPWPARYLVGTGTTTAVNLDQLAPQD